MDSVTIRKDELSFQLPIGWGLIDLTAPIAEQVDALIDRMSDFAEVDIAPEQRAAIATDLNAVVENLPSSQRFVLLVDCQAFRNPATGEPTISGSTILVTRNPEKTQTRAQNLFLELRIKQPGVELVEIGGVSVLRVVLPAASEPRQDGTFPRTVVWTFGVDRQPFWYTAVGNVVSREPGSRDEQFAISVVDAILSGTRIHLDAKEG